MKKLTNILAFALLACSGSAPTTAQPAPTPGGAGVTGTLLIGNKGENTVSFVDLATGRELGRAATGRMPHEIAISPDGGQAAVVAYGAQSIDVFDVRTRAKVRTIDLSPNQGPHGIAWLADGRIIATTERSQSLTIVDTNNGDRVSAISSGQRGHMVAITPDARRAFTANIPDGTVSVLDLAAGTKIRDIATGGRPEGIALTPDGGTLWVGDLEGARVQVYDAASYERIGEVRTGTTPIRVLASPDGRWIVTSNLGNGSLTLIDARTRAVAREIVVSGEQPAGQVTILFSRDGRRIYAAETGAQGDGLAIAP
jgi:YVTN family beta-propeller protein